MLTPGVEYYWRRTDSWNWDGRERWWEVFVVFANGINGSGGACIEERWRWNGSAHTLRTQPRSLTPQDTRELIEHIKAWRSKQEPNPCQPD